MGTRRKIGIIFTTLRDIIRTIRVSEATDIWLLSYFLGGEAKYVLSEQFSTVEVDVDRDSLELSKQGFWPHNVHASLRIFITYEVNRVAHGSVARAKEYYKEYEC